MSCTLTLAPTMTPSTSFTSRRSFRAHSSPIPSPNGSSFRTQHTSPSQSPAPSRVIPPSDSFVSVSMIAALPSLSKSLNHLPSLAGLPVDSIPVYEGMPSVAQKTSHEKVRFFPRCPLSVSPFLRVLTCLFQLRAALGKSPSNNASGANQKMGYVSRTPLSFVEANPDLVVPQYQSSLFTMTPVHSASQSAPAATQMTASSSRRSGFRLYAEDDDEEETDYE